MAAGAGAVFCALSVMALRRDWRLASREDLFPVSLLAFGVFDSLLLTFGRSGFGVPGALSSRYVIFTVVGLSGLYLLTLRAAAGSATGLVALGALLGLIAAGSLESMREDRKQAAALERSHRERAVILRTYRLQPDAELGKLYPVPLHVRQMIPELEKRHWNVFRGQ